MIIDLETFASETVCETAKEKIKFCFSRQEEDSLDDSSDTSTQEKPTRKIYYKLRLYPGKWINILYDRLTLLALLDR